ncbi:MAG: ribosome biogenesis GTP-binding protein YihA/YsxC [Gammaproteobacteria bacterium]
MPDHYRKARFLLSVPDPNLAPPDTGLEIAFAGRSNAGKSSAINAITAQKSLARTSRTPGRTQQLVFFGIDPQRRFVDLPGYGYAKVSSATQKQWRQALDRYFQQRKSLCGIFLIMDIRHPLTPFDRQMIDWCNYRERRLHVLLTKSDKLTYGAGKTTMLEVRKELRDKRIETTVQLFSALKRTGIEEAHTVLDAWFEIGFEDRQLLPDPQSASRANQPQHPLEVGTQSSDSSEKILIGKPDL